MTMFPRTISLNKAWYALIFIASLLPAFIIAPWLADKAHELLLDRALLQEKVYHKQIEAYISLETEHLRSVLVNKADPIALDIDSKHFFASQEGSVTTNLLRRLISREAMFNTITIYDNDAHIITNISRDGHTSAPITTQSLAFIISQRNRTFIGSTLHLRDKHFEFLIAVPLVAHDRVLGTIITTVNVLEFWQSIQKKVTRPEDNMVYLIDGRGALLAHEQGSILHQDDLLTQQPIVRSLLAHTEWNNTHSYQGFEQQQVFGIGSPINNLSWSVISEVPASRIMLPIEKALSYLVFIVFFVHIIFGFFGIFMVRRMLRPIHDLTQAMQSAEEGNYKTTLPHSSYIEINNLIQHFQSMTQTIAYRESELEQFMRAIEHLGESILITDKEGVICYINPAFEKTTGHDQRILGSSILQFTQGSGNNTVCHHLHHCIQTGESWEGKTTAYKANGDSFSALIHISPVSTNMTTTHFVTILQDMSEHDLLEAQFLQAQKTESIGTLVGGIAHDFNNNLAAIMGNTYLAKSALQVGKTQDSLQKVDNIESLSKHAAKVVAQLMAYARQGIVQKENLVFNRIIEDTLTLSSVTIPENIQFSVNIEDNDFLVFADKSQTQQVLMNLLNNARDAVDEVEKPCIELHIKPVIVDANFHKRNPSIPTLHFMRLSIKDNGCGISKSDLKHVFDPFFTTKDVGKGTGLGLSMVYGVVQSHQGVIEVDSTHGKGTVFHIYLPIVEDKPSDIQDNNQAPQHAKGEKIVLIDDDHEVRETTAEVLESFGYQVIQAHHGLQGLECFKQHTDIAIAIVDLVMPKMGGFAFAQKLRQQNNNIGIIFLTGYDNASTMDEHNIGHSLVLQKPVDFVGLQHAIQKMLKHTQET